MEIHSCNQGVIDKLESRLAAANAELGKRATELAEANKKLLDLSGETNCCMECEQRVKDEARFIVALEKCQTFQPNALKICRKQEFIFAGKGGNWEKLAFTFYTDLCEIAEIAKAALSVGEGE